MKHTGLFRDKTTGQWIAVWRRGCIVVHDKLPKYLSTKEEAEAFALENPPA